MTTIYTILITLFSGVIITLALSYMWYYSKTSFIKLFNLLITMFALIFSKDLLTMYPINFGSVVNSDYSQKQEFLNNTSLPISDLLDFHDDIDINQYISHIFWYDLFWNMQAINILHNPILVDNLALPFILLTLGTIPLCMYNTAENIAPSYYICFTTLSIFLILAFISNNLLCFYISFEAILIPMFIIIGLRGTRERRIKASFYFFSYTVFGSFFMLFALLVIYSDTGTFSLSQLYNYEFTFAKQIILWLCFFIGFGVKIPIMPFHLWLPEAHVEAPTNGSVVLASLLLKLGGYGFLRVLLPLCPDGTKFFLPIVYSLSLLSIFYASIIALRQLDMKRIIAYSSIAHMNLIVLGIFSGNIFGISGAIFLMIAHGIVSGALFFPIGVIYDRYHSRLLPYYGGLLQTMPLFGLFFLYFTLSNIGLPGLCNFVGESLLFVGIIYANTFIGSTSMLTIVLSVTYALWLYNRVCFGELQNLYIRKFWDITKSEFILFIILSFPALYLGIYPDILLRYWFFRFIF